ncbi:hypothetical protein EZS27_036670, partial [termite gut metagenome]
EQIIQLATLLDSDFDELITLWLSDQIYELVKDEKMANDAIDIVKSELK